MRQVSTHSISVILPVLDEERVIDSQLRSLAAIDGIDEVLVVDGGSRDGTTDVVARHRDVRLLHSPAGRARQMNTGAAAACGDVLIFLHADVRLPADAAHWVEAVFSDREVVAGAFRTWTVADNCAPWFASLLHLADLRSRYTMLPYGDQALFVRAEAFRAVGGFPEVPLMEDVELARRLRRRGRIRTAPARVRVSGRRFVERPLYYLLADNLISVFHWLGVPADRLASYYPHVR